MTGINLYSRQGHCSYREGGTVTGVDRPLRELVFCNNTSIISYVHTAMVLGTLHVWRMGRFERTIGQKCTLYESYVLNPPRSNLLRDPNTNFRIEYTLQ